MSIMFIALPFIILHLLSLDESQVQSMSLAAIRDNYRFMDEFRKLRIHKKADVVPHVREFERGKGSVGLGQVRGGEIIAREADQLSGWKLVQKSIHQIIELGQSEGILQVRDQQPAFNVTGLTAVANEEAHCSNEHRTGEKVFLPTDDITVMHEAIPFVPVPIALFCFTSNLIIPGMGTILSGFATLCMGQPRVNLKEGRKLATILINSLVGISQFFTITFLFVGWFWSIAWGILLIIHSMQYREALLQRRQEAVATTAIEALTKDSILHRREVKSLVRKHMIESKEVVSSSAPVRKQTTKL